MKNWIKTSIAAAVIATGAIGSTAALAWGGHCDGPRGGKAGWSQMAPEQMKAKMAERAELHMARLELALALTPEQKPAFESFKTDMKARAERMVANMAERRTASQPKTAIERMQRMEEMSKLRQAEMGEARRARTCSSVTSGRRAPASQIPNWSSPARTSATAVPVSS